MSYMPKSVFFTIVEISAIRMGCSPSDQDPETSGSSNAGFSFTGIHHDPPKIPNLHRRLQRLRYRLQPLRRLVFARARRQDDGALRCAGYGLRRYLRTCGGDDGTWKRACPSYLQPLCRHLSGVRRRVCQTRHGALPGSRKGLPPVRRGMPHHGRHGVSLLAHHTPPDLAVSMPGTVHLRHAWME